MFKKYALTGSIVHGRRSRKYYLTTYSVPGLHKTTLSFPFDPHSHALLYVLLPPFHRWQNKNQRGWLPKVTYIRRMLFLPKYGRYDGSCSTERLQGSGAVVCLLSAPAWSPRASQGSDSGSHIQEFSVKSISFWQHFFYLISDSELVLC